MSNTALQCGPLLSPLPELLTLEPAEADLYWERLGAAGLRYFYGAHPRCGRTENLYGTALDVSPALADYLVGALRTVEALLKGYIQREGLSAWLRGRAPTFGGVELNFPAVNRHLEEALLGEGDERSVIPLLLDPILTQEEGRAGLRVVEIQSGFGYAATLWSQLRALGHDPHAPCAYRGAPALDTFRRYRARFTGGEDVSVLATFPTLTGLLPEEASWAAALSASGAPTGYFLATDLQRDEEGWFHFEYEHDPRTGVPLLDAHDRPVRHGPPRKRRIRSVIAMQTQTELDHVHERLSPAARALFLEFLSDARTVRWLHPHAGWYIADKSLLGRLRADLLGGPYAALFVPCHGPGEIVAQPGSYVLKPTDGVSGRGVRDLQIAPGAPFIVPPRHVVQRRFQPYPFPQRLTASLAGAFPVPAGAAGAEAFLADPRNTTCAIELRIMSLPGSTAKDGSYLFMARVAPTWDPVEPAAPVLTNLGRIQTAVWNSPRIHAENWRHTPFGWTAVTIGAGRP
jgi:hypothetical protein